MGNKGTWSDHWAYVRKLEGEYEALACRFENLAASLKTIAELPKYNPPMSPRKIMNDMQQVAQQALEKSNG